MDLARTYVGVAAFAASLMSAACGTGTSDVPDRAQPGGPAAAGLAEVVHGSYPAKVSHIVYPLELGLEMPARVRAGQPVPLKTMLRNVGKEPLELSLGGAEDPAVFDFVATRKDGPEVWRRLYGAQLSLNGRFLVLAPGQTVIFGHTWDQRDNKGRWVPPGTYHLRGVIPASGGAMNTESRVLVITP
jgi:hypothetical protein